MEIKYLIEDIWQKSHYIGDILIQINTSREDGYGYLLLPSTINLLEGCLKYKLSNSFEIFNDNSINEEKIYKKNYYDLLKISKKNNVISEDDFLLLNNLRKFRNKLFHDMNESSYIEFEGIAYMITENSTHEYIYDKYIKTILKIILKLI